MNPRILLFTLLAAPLLAQNGFPWQNESLHYSIEWQSGLSLGDASLTAQRTEKGWNFDATVSAGVPGFAIDDKYHSAATLDLCSTEFTRDQNHAGKKSRERTTFDQKAGTAERVTLFPDGGAKPGKSNFDIPTCARDALAYLYYAREELGQGRMPAAQDVYFGSAYALRMDYTGAQDITVAGKSAVTDHLAVSEKGPKSNFGFEVFYARDAARTPLEILPPLSLGRFTLELVR
jgi:hypothetical protein